MAANTKTEVQAERDLPAEMTDADLNVVVGGANNQISMLQMISAVLKDLHDIRSSIVRNIAG
jgi:hypothetical protein